MNMFVAYVCFSIVILSAVGCGGGGGEQSDPFATEPRGVYFGNIYSRVADGSLGYRAIFRADGSGVVYRSGTAAINFYNPIRGDDSVTVSFDGYSGNGVIFGNTLRETTGTGRFTVNASNVIRGTYEADGPDSGTLEFSRLSADSTGEPPQELSGQFIMEAFALGEGNTSMSAALTVSVDGSVVGSSGSFGDCLINGSMAGPDAVIGVYAIELTERCGEATRQISGLAFFRNSGNGQERGEGAVFAPGAGAYAEIYERSCSPSC